MIPEPSTGVLAVFGFTDMIAWSCRLARRARRQCRATASSRKCPINAIKARRIGSGSEGQAATIGARRRTIDGDMRDHRLGHEFPETQPGACPRLSQAVSGLIAADKLAHELGVDEEFLDELVAGL